MDEIKDYFALEKIIRYFKTYIYFLEMQLNTQKCSYNCNYNIIMKITDSLEHFINQNINHDNVIITIKDIISNFLDLDLSQFHSFRLCNFLKLAKEYNCNPVKNKSLNNKSVYLNYNDTLYMINIIDESLAKLLEIEVIIIIKIQILELLINFYMEKSIIQFILLHDNPLNLNLNTLSETIQSSLKLNCDLIVNCNNQNVNNQAWNSTKNNKNYTTNSTKRPYKNYKTFGLFNQTIYHKKQNNMSTQISDDALNSISLSMNTKGELETFNSEAPKNIQGDIIENFEPNYMRSIFQSKIGQPKKFQIENDSERQSKNEKTVKQRRQLISNIFLNNDDVKFKSLFRDKMTYAELLKYGLANPDDLVNKKNIEVQKYKDITTKDQSKWYQFDKNHLGPIIFPGITRNRLIDRTHKLFKPHFENLKLIINCLPFKVGLISKTVSLRDVNDVLKYFLKFINEIWCMIEKYPTHDLIENIKDTYNIMLKLLKEMSVNIGNAILQMHEFIYMINIFQDLVDFKLITRKEMAIFHSFQVKCQQTFMDDIAHVIIQYAYIPAQSDNTIKMFHETRRDRRIWHMEHVCHCRVLLLEPDHPRNKTAPDLYRTIEICFDSGQGQWRAAVPMLQRLVHPKIDLIKYGSCILRFATGVYIECKHQLLIGVGSPRVTLTDYYASKTFGYFCNKFKQRRIIQDSEIVKCSDPFDKYLADSVSFNP